MKKKLFLLLFIYSFCFLLSQESQDKKLELFLSQQKDITFKKIYDTKDSSLKYELGIKQPMDWKNPQKGYFTQRVILKHTDFSAPTLIETEGYQLYGGKNELQELLNSNYIDVEHRYFGSSVPDSTKFDWKDLNLYNATHDLHHINQIFKKIYQGKWISSGISKGGQTTIYYRYFFPNDVDISIPYVAPINYSLEDKRIYSFLKKVGTPECRKKIEDFQIFLLKNEKEILKYLEVYSQKRNLTYNYLGSIGKAFEYTVLEYSFSFWQWGYSCTDIPQQPTIEEALNYLLSVCDISIFSDADLKQYAPHYYQAASEMGYYGYNIEPFKNYLNYFKDNPSGIFPPKEAGKITYSPELNRKLKKWLDTKANNMIYIYGGIDTWSATKVEPSPKTNSIILEIPSADHSKARIINMDKKMLQLLKDKLWEWAKIKI